MNLAPLILAALQAFPVCWADRGDSRKTAQLETIAGAVAEAICAAAAPGWELSLSPVADAAQLRVPARGWPCHSPLDSCDPGDHGAGRSVTWRGDSRDLAALLVTIAWHESKLCLATHAGRPGTHGARGLWQVERGSRVAPFRTGLGATETLEAASAAASLLSRSWQCGASARGWLTAYAGVACGTDWRGLAERVRTFRWVRARLGRAA